MSMYNLLFGKNPSTEKILAIIGLEEWQVERFRDVDIDEAEKEIIITARTGGLNREDFPQNALKNNPNYLYDEDDEFDNTYAYYHFRIPKSEK